MVEIKAIPIRRTEMYLNFQAKGLLPDRTLESFIQKSTEGAIPKLLVVG